MEKQSVILIFDVGKTNKKILLFDVNYRIVFEESVQFKEDIDEEGFPCEDVHVLTDWVKSSFEKILSDERFEVKAVNFSAYGASFVYVDEDLNPILPLYNYLKPYSDNLKRKFYESYGGETQFSKKTASPVLGSLNSGMQMYRLKHERPDMFAKIKYALHLPQYLSSILTKSAYSEITSIGCHTNLWDFKKDDYHFWVSQEGIKQTLPPLLKSDACLTIQHDGRSIYVGIGLHDSSSALIPYLYNFQEPFVLISTGTWCISLNPFNNSALSKNELENDCLCYLSYQGHPVKASRLFAGYEHEQQVKRLSEYYRIPFEQITKTKYNPSLMMLKVREAFGIQTLKKKKSTGDFAQSDLSEFLDSEEAYHELMVDIVAKQLVSTRLILLGNGVKRIFIDGGFSKNNIYMNFMAAVFPGIEVYAASVAQATALGAALTIHKQWNKTPLQTDLIELKFYSDAPKGLEV